MSTLHYYYYLFVITLSNPIPSLQVHEVISGRSRTYLLFPPASTDLHTYVRTRRRLREHQARHLFRQVVSAVKEAHSRGIVLRDLKLRKFVFTTESR